MLINTRDFGEIEVAEEELLIFPAGIFAFEEMRKFALLSPLGEDVYPKWLQSAEDVSPCFIVFNPFIVDENYTVKLEPAESKLLKFLKFEQNSADNNSSDKADGNNADHNMELLVIATVPSDFKKTTVNMKAPIVINKEKRLAAQIIQNGDYDFKFPLYSQSTQEESTGE